MKPDKNTCLNCSKGISPRATYCSDKCTKAYKRNSDKRSDKPNSDNPKNELGHTNSDKDDFRASLTKTDKTFYDRALRDFGEPYYRFDAPLKKDNCARCKTPFNTRMSLLIYCSYEHYSAAISGRH